MTGIVPCQSVRSKMTEFWGGSAKTRPILNFGGVMLKVGELAIFKANHQDSFCRDYIQNGATCKVLEIHPNTATVRFTGQDDTDLVSLAFLR